MRLLKPILAVFTASLLSLAGAQVLAGKRTVHRSKRKSAKRCRDIFCTSSVVTMDGGKKKGLTSAQVEKVMRRVATQFNPCLMLERRRNPRMKWAKMEFVISNAGRVLATRVNRLRRSSLTRCIHKKLKRVRFPKNKQRRQVASYSMAVVN